MARKKEPDYGDLPRRRPPLSLEARQARLESLALDLIEKRLIEGDASAQETTMYAKSATTRGRLEEKRLEHEIELMKSKKAQLDSLEEMQQMLKEAMDAMTGYRVDGELDGPDVHGSF